MKRTLKRKAFHLTTLQIEQLKKVSNETGYPVAEVIRRAIDEYLERRFPDVSNYPDQSTQKSES